MDTYKDFSQCRLDLIIRVMIERKLKEGESICDGCSYSKDECPNSTRISCNGELLKYVAEPKHKVGAFCKNCATESAMPIAKVRWNRKEAYVLECPKCKGRYALYLEHYTRKYIGFTNGYGEFIQPTIKGGVTQEQKNRLNKKLSDNNVNILELMKQNRHSNPNQTYEYLKSLEDDYCDNLNGKFFEI